MIITVQFDTSNPADKRRLFDLLFRPGPPRPGPLRLAFKEQVSMSQFQLTFVLPPVGASDVAKRELSCTVNGGVAETRIYDGQPTASDPWVFNADDTVTLSLIDVDGHGNRSEPSPALTFVVVDDVPPPAPGEIGIAAKVQLP
jgi:hypothetical protein